MERAAAAAAHTAAAFPASLPKCPVGGAWTGNAIATGPDGAVASGADADADTTYGTCVIDGATASTYIPKGIDDGDYLTARAVYKDGHGDTVNNAFSASESAAEERPNANAGPSFPR